MALVLGSPDSTTGSASLHGVLIETGVPAPVTPDATQLDGVYPVAPQVLPAPPEDARPADPAQLSDSVSLTGSFNLSVADRLSDGFNDSVSVLLTRPDISDYQFVADVAPWMPFGYGRSVNLSKFTPGSFDTRTQDIPAVNADVRVFGTDRRTPPSWSFELFVDDTTPAGALGWMDLLGQVWDNDVRQTPNGAIALRYQVAGRKRRVYGRPRRFTPVMDSVQRGKIDIVADFALAEDVYYDDNEQTLTLSVKPVVLSNSGIILPGVLPWQFTQPAPNPVTQQAVVGGTQKTWFKIKILGPISVPWLQIGSLTWQLNGSIPAGQSLTLSGRPWDVGVKSSTGSWRPDVLDPRSRLSQLRMSPGAYPVQFGGFDPTGSSQAVVSWRNAYRTL